MDLIAKLTRTARRHGWTARHNQLDYYTLRFHRPEDDDRESVVRVRITHRIVDAAIEVNGLRQQFLLPPVSRIGEVLAR